MSCRKKTPLQNPKQHQFNTNLQKTSQQRTRWQTLKYFSVHPEKLWAWAKITHWFLDIYPPPSASIWNILKPIVKPPHALAGTRRKPKWRKNLQIPTSVFLGFNKSRPTWLTVPDGPAGPTHSLLLRARWLAPGSAQNQAAVVQPTHAATPPRCHGKNAHTHERTQTSSPRRAWKTPSDIRLSDRLNFPKTNNPYYRSAATKARSQLTARGPAGNLTWAEEPASPTRLADSSAARSVPPRCPLSVTQVCHPPCPSEHRQKSLSSFASYRKR